MTRRQGAKVGVRRASLAVAAVVLLGVAQNVAQNAASATHQTVTAVTGSAYGYFAAISLFGGPPGIRGPTPTVTLAADASNSPQTATAATGSVVYGPATLLSTGPINVTTAGTTGTDGSVTSTATIGAVNTSGQEVFTAAGMSSTCTANESGVTGSTTITGGTLVTDDGNPDDPTDDTIVVIPTNPAPNTTYNGVIRGVGDSFRAVFNEQIVNPDGSLTVNAYHLYLLGPTAVGDLIVGQVVCGVTTTVAPTTTTTVPTTTTTVPTTTTTVPTTTTTTTAPPGDDCRPGYGKGDRNHCHSGPPGLTGDRPGGGDQPLAARLARNASSEPLVLGAVGLVVLAGLILPLPRRRRLRGD